MSKKGLLRVKLRSSIGHVVLIVAALIGRESMNRAVAQELFSTWERPAEVSVSTGNAEVLLPSGHEGLTHFPDEPICILNESPMTFLMVCGQDTFLMQGNKWQTTTPVAKVLSPGPPGSVDNNYAGVSSVYRDEKQRRWIGFYHAEDKEGIGKIGVNDVQGFYGTICAAEATDDAQGFTKLGPTITADKPKLPRGWETEGGPPEAWLAQGVGVPSVCEMSDGKNLLCIYTEWSNRVKRGVQLCAARCPVESLGLPGSWKKYHNGAFNEDGLGGHETPVITANKRADTYDPHVQYVKDWGRYAMVFGAGVHEEVHAMRPIHSGLFVSTSKDGIAWSKPVKIETIFALVLNGQECKVHPMLLITRTTSNAITGQLLYGYTPRWPDTPHHLAGQTIQIKLTDTTNDKTNGIAARNRPTPKGKTASKMKPNEQSFAGKYRLIVTNTSTKMKDAPRTVEVRADNTLKTSDGLEGAWKLNNGKLEIAVNGFKISRANKAGKLWKGSLVDEATKTKFTYEFERVGD